MIFIKFKRSRLLNNYTFDIFIESTCAYIYQDKYNIAVKCLLLPMKNKNKYITEKIIVDYINRGLFMFSEVHGIIPTSSNIIPVSRDIDKDKICDLMVEKSKGSENEKRITEDIELLRNSKDLIFL